MKRISLKIFFFSFLILLFHSCIKERTSNKTIISGTVSNQLTGEFVQNIPIEIIECEGIPRKCLKTIHTIFTDHKGQYNFSFPMTDNRKTYKIAVGVNDILGNTPYPYYYSIEKYMRNEINFSQFPIKNVNLHIKVRPQNKNWLQILVRNADYKSSFFYDCYFGENPVAGFDSIYNFKIEAGRQYRIWVGMSNKLAQYTYVDNEFVTHAFKVDNIDTSFIDFTVP